MLLKLMDLCYMLCYMMGSRDDDMMGSRDDDMMGSRDGDMMGSRDGDMMGSRDDDGDGGAGPAHARETDTCTGGEVPTQSVGSITRPQQPAGSITRPQQSVGSITGPNARGRGGTAAVHIDTAGITARVKAVVQIDATDPTDDDVGDDVGSADIQAGQLFTT